MREIEEEVNYMMEEGWMKCKEASWTIYYRRVPRKLKKKNIKQLKSQQEQKFNVTKIKIILYE